MESGSHKRTKKAPAISKCSGIFSTLPTLALSNRLKGSKKYLTLNFSLKAPLVLFMIF